MGKYEIGKRVVWKDRPGRIRIMEYTKDGAKEARRVNYLKYHENENIKGYRILQLDMNPFNFNEDNLVKVTIKEMNMLLRSKMLFKTKDYELNKKNNIIALRTVKNKLKKKGDN